MEKKPAVAYVRVSSLAQSLEMQRHAITAAAAARGFEVGRWYEEKASGKTIDRPVLGDLRADIRAGRVVCPVWVYRIDRFARSGIRDMFALVEEFRDHKIEILTVADGFDLQGPAADVILAVMAWAAKVERLAINERIASARARLGNRWGRPSRVSKAVEADIIKRLGRGETVRAISQAVGVPRSTVGRVSQKVHAKIDPQV